MRYNYYTSIFSKSKTQCRKEGTLIHPFTLIRYKSIDSTNTALKAMEDAPNGTVLCSLSQSAGRGRLGRTFVSDQGGLYLSILLRRQEPLDQLLHVTPMAAVAVRRAIRDLYPTEIDIKWINDLQIRGKKICGILTEVAPHGGVIIGIGINCNTPAFPEELREIAGSLMEFCGKIDTEALLQALLRRLQELDEGLFSHKAQWMEEYRRNCISLHRDVLLLSPTGQREAYAEGIGDNGELLVRFPDGSREAVSMGEVSLRNQTTRKEASP